MTLENKSNLDAAILAEREYCRKLMIEYSKETSDLERYALTVAGAIWSWSIANSTTVGAKLLFFLPVLTTFLFGIRALSIYRLRGNIRVFLRTLPEAAGISSAFGWEHYVIGHGYNFRVASAKIFWAILQLTAVVVSIYAHYKLP